MEIRVDTLRETLELLKPIVPKKTALPVLHNIFLTTGRAEATNLEAAAAVENDEFDGNCLIPFHSVAELLKRVPGNELLTIIQKGKHLSLTWSGGSASYEVTSPNEYPGFPKVKAQPQKTVDGDTLVPALYSMVGYCATKEDRPVLNGVILSLGENLEISAGDGFRMAYKSLPIDFLIDGIDTAIIPASSIRLLEHLWHKTGREAPNGDDIVKIVMAKRRVELTFDADKMMAKFGRVTFVTTLIQGTPPKMKEMLPKEPLPSVRIMAPDFERAVRRVRDIAADNKGIIRLTWSKEVMTFSAKSEEKGSVETTISVEAEEVGKVAINANYLLDYIKGKEGLVTMGVAGPQKPVSFRHSGSPMVLMMPMFIQW